ncbi:MAG TPA: pseudouridine synthase [Dokdonella sp.]|uniref:pseudouridine synthase n=1 Tax=Dokdonella sp. TaxID=2291710 RepID=UPI0025C005A6|nr:pseudouridine synthase [Dokdonella sp.]MBX3693395.1 pseudouridine synthase [Dokdonella sp.]MCW5569143.1 pseudouridine synthase [Dokdonella sp.]HNR92438.1 pseudouridine synthase [Dokdonella sp.]
MKRTATIETDTSPASTVHLRPGPWNTVFEAVCAHFPRIPVETWRARFARGRVLDEDGAPVIADHPHRPGLCLRYFREVEDEALIPFVESIVHADEHLVVADKPHFLPVAPTGRHVSETLLTRLVRRLGNRDLVPLHRIDRDTAGLVLFSADRSTRARYQRLFRERAIAKHYEALAPPLERLDFPLVHRSHLVAGTPFFRMQEINGTPNSETRIDVIERGPSLWRYALQPITGRKHQLRVHMAALGAPIADDAFYPELRAVDPDDFSRPLRLLARVLAFTDPLDGRLRRFESRLAL